MTIFYIIRQWSEVYVLSAVFLQEINTTLPHCSPRQFWTQSILGDLSLPTESSSSLCHSFHTLIWFSSFTFWHPFLVLQRLVLLNCPNPLQAPAYFTPVHLCDFSQMFSLPGMSFPSSLLLFILQDNHTRVSWKPSLNLPLLLLSLLHSGIVPHAHLWPNTLLNWNYLLRCLSPSWNSLRLRWVLLIFAL